MKLLILASLGCGKGEMRHVWESALKTIELCKGKDGMLMLSRVEVGERTLLGKND